MNSLLIVIATYNEIDNLPALVDRLFELIPKAHILVVDDNSPDGTGAWCAKRAIESDNFFHIGRSGKLGLGSATLAGLKFAIEDGYDFAATMDADWSHDPVAMETMWSKIISLQESDTKNRLGALIGSRYVKGGRIEGWPFHRRLASKLVNSVTRLLLRLPTRDNTGAMRIYRNDALKAANVLSIETSGYGYLEEILLLLHRSEFFFDEVPITFTDRAKGKSKATLGEGYRVLRNIVRLSLNRHK